VCAYSTVTYKNYPERFLETRALTRNASATFPPGGTASESSVARPPSSYAGGRGPGKSQHGLQQEANRKPSTETFVCRTLTDVPSLEKSGADLASDLSSTATLVLG
jgi:hypothetical protein